MASLPARLAFLVSVTAVLRMTADERCAAGNSGSAANRCTLAPSVCRPPRRFGVTIHTP